MDVAASDVDLASIANGLPLTVPGEAKLLKMLPRLAYVRWSVKKRRKREELTDNSASTSDNVTPRRFEERAR